jgi:serine/threonine protein kinase
VVDRSLWQSALDIYEAALLLPNDERERWAAERADGNDRLIALVARLMAAHVDVESGAVLNTLPKMESPKYDVVRELDTIGNYVLVERIGRGGMGEVWRARYADSRIEREVAIKLPAAYVHSQARHALHERFVRERRLLARLEHPNIARLYDAGVSDTGQAFMALELVEGVAIDAYCESRTLGLFDRIELYLQVIDAVDFAHRQLVLHRDLKPSNVLINADGQAKLLDFGVAKMVSGQSPELHADPLTEFASSPITLAYAAPEQITDADLSTATDVYALGVTLYRLLVGCSPYAPKNDTRHALEQSVLHEIPKRASEQKITEAFAQRASASSESIRRALKGDLDLILAKALKKSPAERYASAAALGEDLRRFLRREAISARPDSLTYRIDRFVARHRLGVAASTVAGVALLATAITAVQQAHRATQQAKETARQLNRVEASQKFVNGLFANADPEHFRGKPLPAEDILKRGVADAKRIFASDPEALANVLGQLGDIYFRVGLTEPLLDVQIARVAALRSTQQVDPNQWADALTALGQAQSNAPELSVRQQAIASFSEVLTLHQRSAATISHDRRVFALAMVADQHRIYQRLDHAASYAKDAVSLAAATLPDTHATAIAALQVRALVARDLGQLEEARELLKRVIAADTAGNSRGRVDQFNAQRQLVSLDYDSGDYVKAREGARELLTIAQENLGEINTHAASLRRLVVNASERAGVIKAALHDAETLLPTELASNDALRRGSAWLTKARVWLSADQLQAVPSALSSAEKELAAYPLWLNRLAVLQAEYWLRRNDRQNALAIVDSALERARERNQTVSREVAALQEWRARALVIDGNEQGARTYIDLACKLRARFHPEDHPQRIACEAMQVLLNTDIDPMARAHRISQLHNIIIARNGRAALVQSLAQAKASVTQGDDLRQLALFLSD